MLLLIIPQRYKFSSKSQHSPADTLTGTGCWLYRKGTNFRANHNTAMQGARYERLLIIPQRYKFSSKSQRDGDIQELYEVVDYTAKVQIFEQITTGRNYFVWWKCCWLYRKGTNFRANHNIMIHLSKTMTVVDYTAKVQIFEQITTRALNNKMWRLLLIIPQRYKFSSKSQPPAASTEELSSCWLYRKGTNFRANHNLGWCNIGCF